MYENKQKGMEKGSRDLGMKTMFKQRESLGGLLRLHNCQSTLGSENRCYHCRVPGEKDRSLSREEIENTDRLNNNTLDLLFDNRGF